MSIALGHERDVAIADLLDRALNKGVVLSGEATISLAGVDLIYVGLKVLVASYETASRIRDKQPSAAPLSDERDRQ
jgi:gas vesicle structural protein